MTAGSYFSEGSDPLLPVGRTEVPGDLQPQLPPWAIRAGSSTLPDLSKPRMDQPDERVCRKYLQCVQRHRMGQPGKGADVKRLTEEYLKNFADRSRTGFRRFQAADQGY